MHELTIHSKRNIIDFVNTHDNPNCGRMKLQ